MRSASPVIFLEMPHQRYYAACMLNQPGPQSPAGNQLQ
jgi:hypothetical protein